MLEDGNINVNHLIIKIHKIEPYNVYGCVLFFVLEI